MNLSCKRCGAAVPDEILAQIEQATEAVDRDVYEVAVAVLCPNCSEEVKILGLSDEQIIDDDDDDDKTVH